MIQLNKIVYALILPFAVAVNIANCYSMVGRNSEDSQTKVLQDGKEFTSFEVVFGGDVSFDSPIRNDNGSACDYEPLLGNIKKYLDDADYAVVNLESPFVSRQIANNGIEYLPGKGIHNKAWPESVSALKHGGVDAVTVANNHLLDFGDEAVALTSNILASNNIATMGMSEGSTKFYRQTPIIATIKGVRVGMLGYCNLTECEIYRGGSMLGQAIFEEETVKFDIAELKSKVDIIVVFMHWGTEYMAIPNEADRNIAVFLVQQGVHLVMGSHPHVLQGHEYINNTLVKYSLGNLVFHSHFTYMGQLAGRPDAKAIHARYIELSKKARGPGGKTELFNVRFNKQGVIDAQLLPVRVKVDKDTGCLYPTPYKEDAWIQVCGLDDDNCFSPREEEKPITDGQYFMKLSSPENLPILEKVSPTSPTSHGFSSTQKLNATYTTAPYYNTTTK